MPAAGAVPLQASCHLSAPSRSALSAIRPSRPRTPPGSVSRMDIPSRATSWASRSLMPAVPLPGRLRCSIRSAWPCSSRHPRSHGSPERTW